MRTFFAVLLSCFIWVASAAIATAADENADYGSMNATESSNMVQSHHDMDSHHDMGMDSGYHSGSWDGHYGCGSCGSCKNKCDRGCGHKSKCGYKCDSVKSSCGKCKPSCGSYKPACGSCSKPACGSCSRYSSDYDTTTWRDDWMA